MSECKDVFELLLALCRVKILLKYLGFPLFCTRAASVCIVNNTVCGPFHGGSSPVISGQFQYIAWSWMVALCVREKVASSRIIVLVYDREEQ